MTIQQLQRLSEVSGKDFTCQLVGYRPILWVGCGAVDFADMMDSDDYELLAVVSAVFTDWPVHDVKVVRLAMH